MSENSNSNNTETKWTQIRALQQMASIPVSLWQWPRRSSKEKTEVQLQINVIAIYDTVKGQSNVGV